MESACHLAQLNPELLAEIALRSVLPADLLNLSQASKAIAEGIAQQNDAFWRNSALRYWPGLVAVTDSMRETGLVRDGPVSEKSRFLLFASLHERAIQYKMMQEIRKFSAARAHEEGRYGVPDEVVDLYTFDAFLRAHSKYLDEEDDKLGFLSYWGDCEFDPNYNITSEDEFKSYFDNGDPALGRLVFIGPITGDGGRFCYWRVDKNDLLRDSPVVWLDSEGGCQILAPNLSSLNAVQANQIEGEILAGYTEEEVADSDPIEEDNPIYRELFNAWVKAQYDLDVNKNPSKLAQSAKEKFGDPQAFLEWVCQQSAEEEAMKRGSDAESDYPNSLRGCAIFLLCEPAVKNAIMRLILKNKGSIAYGLDHSTHFFSDKAPVEEMQQKIDTDRKSVV